MGSGRVAIAEAAISEGEIPIGAGGALSGCKVRLTLTLTVVRVAVVVERPVRVALAGFAFWEVVESRCALIAVESGVVRLARTLAASDLTHFVTSSVVIAVAGLAEREAVMTAATSVTSRSVELGSAFASSSSFVAISRGIRQIAIARTAHVSCVQMDVEGPVISGSAFVAIVAHGVVATVLTDSTTLVFPVDVDGGL